MTSPKSNQQTIVLVSGANTGIGLAVAKALVHDHNYHVVIGSRNAAAGEEAAASINREVDAQTEAGRTSSGRASSVQLDLLSDASISFAVASIERDFGRLDVLINNAGVLLDVIARTPSSEGDGGEETWSTRDLFTRTFGPNVIGTACLTEACLRLLRTPGVVAVPPRIVFVSSKMGSLELSKDETTFWYGTDYKAYDASKAAMNMLALNYARILKEKEGEEGNVGYKGNGLVNVVCPGLVRTKMTGYHEYGSSVEEGARRIVEVATMVEGEGCETGGFSDKDGSVPW